MTKEHYPHTTADFTEMSLDDFSSVIRRMDVKNFERIYHMHMTKEQSSLYQDWIEYYVPASKLSPMDFGMGNSETKDMTLHAITGDRVLYLLDALEFYAKHHKNIVPSRIAKSMKYESGCLHLDIIDSWRKGVPLDDDWEPFTSDDELAISELLDAGEK